MKKPAADCKHAREILAHKFHYSQEEYDTGEGCWHCGQPLELEERRPHTEADLELTCEKSLYEMCQADPEMKRKTLEFMNRPTYVCRPCWKNHLGQLRRDFRPEDGRDIKEIIEEMRGQKGREKYKRDTMERIAEVEACVPDCPERDNLEAWRKNLAQADEKIEGFDDD